MISFAAQQRTARNYQQVRQTGLLSFFTSTLAFPILCYFSSLMQDIVTQVF
jgi:hypothetical protein